MGHVDAICTSAEKGERKTPLPEARFVAGHGIQNDAHAGLWHRQVSVLAAEEIERVRRGGLPNLKPGDFAENVVLSGLDLGCLGLGSRIRLGAQVLLSVTQIGKVCHTPCRIYHLTGNCIMPTRGLFTRVIEGGLVHMGDAAEIVEPVPRERFQAAVLTISDRCARNETEDTAGPAVGELLTGRLAAHLYAAEILPDEAAAIAGRLRHYCDGHSIDLVLTVGGTGFSPRDVTPEATRQVIERPAPGLDEAMRAASLARSPHAMLSRGCCGIRGGTLIVNLPGSLRGAVENLEAILPALPHGLAKLRGDESDCGAAPRNSPPMLEHLPVFGICGWSGSGKTTLLERIVPQLLTRRLSVAVVKHDVHGIAAEPDNKDTARLFRAGADVVAYDPAQSLTRQAADAEISVEWRIGELAKRYDLVLVEGFKHAAWPKVWLQGDESDLPPSDIADVVAVLPREGDRAGPLTAILDDFLLKTSRRTPPFGCILIGGQNRRMGSPKHLLPHEAGGGGTWLEHTVDVLRCCCGQIVIAGGGTVPDALEGLPRLADVPEVSGPLAGLLAAMRWAPAASWLLAACDHPRLSPAAVEWLLAERGPGVWSVLPHLSKSQHSEPLLAFYDLRVRPFLENLAHRQSASLQAVAEHPKTRRVGIPHELAEAWRDVDTPEERACL